MRPCCKRVAPRRYEQLDLALDQVTEVAHLVRYTIDPSAGTVTMADLQPEGSPGTEFPTVRSIANLALTSFSAASPLLQRGR